MDKKMDMTITDEIFQVGGSGFTAPEDAAVYLINVEGRAAIVDAGCGHATEMLLNNIRNCDVADESIDYLLITHCHFDHTGGAAGLKQHFGLKIVAHEKDAVFLEAGNQKVTGALWYGAVLEPFTVDVKLTQSEEIIQLGSRSVSALHVPGHSPGSVVYLMESDGRKVLFAQDVHGPIHPDLLSDPAEYQFSLKRMVDLDADILCEGHFGIFRGKEQVREFIRSFIINSGI
jgi:glyoxylase-like metal-dependent hydrolase (beta-lactamase superfamily II)